MEDTTQETVVETPEMDKVEATETTGVAQEVTDDAQTLAEKEAKADEEAEESLFKTLMEKKGFKSEEDLAKAYSELEGSFSKKSADAAELEKLVDAILSTPDPETDETETVVEDNRLAAVEAKLDTKTVAERHSDFYDYAAEMKEIAESYDNADKLFKGEKGIEMLYKIAKANKQDEVIAKAREEGRNEVTAKEVEKLTAQVASDTKAKRPDQKVFTRAEIAAMSLEEYTEHEAEIKAQAAAGLIE